MDGYSGKCANQVTSDKVSRLCQRAVDYTVNKNGRRAKGSDQENIVVHIKQITVEPSDKTYTAERTGKRPQMLPFVNERFLIYNDTRQFDISFQPSFHDGFRSVNRQM